MGKMAVIKVKEFRGVTEAICHSIKAAEDYLKSIGLEGKDGRIFRDGKVLPNSLYGRKSITIVFVHIDKS